MMAWLHDNDASILYSHRNHVDRIISGKVDELSMSAAHCTALDQACVEAHEQARVTMETGDTLLEELREDVRKQSALLAMLVRSGIRYQTVTFEQLFDESDSLATWYRVLQFLTPKQAKRYSAISGSQVIPERDLEEALSSTIRVGAPHQEARVSNYGEVVATLEGTEFQSLLH